MGDSIFESRRTLAVREAAHEDAITNRSRLDRREQQALRVRLLNEETDRMIEAAGERAKSVDSKSSFLAVAAGIVIAAALTRTWQAPGLIALLPIFFAVAALAAAAVALRPGKRKDLTPRNIVQTWLDSEATFATAELEILKSKVGAFELREEGVRGRAMIGTFGFGFLLLSAICLVLVYSTEIF